MNSKTPSPTSSPGRCSLPQHKPPSMSFRRSRVNLNSGGSVDRRAGLVGCAGKLSGSPYVLVGCAGGRVRARSRGTWNAGSQGDGDETEAGRGQRWVRGRGCAVAVVLLRWRWPQFSWRRHLVVVRLSELGRQRWERSAWLPKHSATSLLRALRDHAPLRSSSEDRN